MEKYEPVNVKILGGVKVKVSLCDEDGIKYIALQPKEKKDKYEGGKEKLKKLTEI